MKENKNEWPENDPGPSRYEAFEYLETAMKWLEWHKNTDLIQVTNLRRIRNMAALRRMSSLKPTTI